MLERDLDQLPQQVVAQYDGAVGLAGRYDQVRGQGGGRAGLTDDQPGVRRGGRVPVGDSDGGQ